MPLDPSAMRAPFAQANLNGSEASAAQGLQRQSDLHAASWTRILSDWRVLRCRLLPLSEVLQQSERTKQGPVLEESLLRRNADTTVERCLHVVNQFFQGLDDLGLDLAQLQTAEILDLLANLQSDPCAAIHRSNSLKALRWLCKCWSINWPMWDPLFRALEAPVDTLRREALPLPPGFLVYLEREVLNDANPDEFRVFCGSCLVCIMSSLRFSDAMHIEWRSLSLAGDVLRGSSTGPKRPALAFLLRSKVEVF